MVTGVFSINFSETYYLYFFDLEFRKINKDLKTKKPKISEDFGHLDLINENDPLSNMHSSDIIALQNKGELTSTNSLNAAGTNYIICFP